MFILWSAAVLTVGAIWPLQTVPVLAGHQLHEYVLPAAYAQPKSPKITEQHPFVRPVPDCNIIKCIALSFDDGPTAAETPQVLDTLERTNTAATFFVIGRNVPGHEALLRRMYQDGFEVGNHSYNHPNFARLTPGQIDYELAATQSIIEQAGIPKPTLFRPPYGVVNPAVVGRYGLQIALWNEDPRDWEAADPAAVIAKVIGDAHPGGIVDLHDIHQVTADALPGIIDQLQAQDFHFVTVSQLLHSRERSGNAPFYGYAADSYHF